MCAPRTAPLDRSATSDRDVAPVVGVHSGLLQVETGGVGAAPDAEEDKVGGEGLYGLAVGVGHQRPDLSSGLGPDRYRQPDLGLNDLVGVLRAQPLRRPQHHLHEIPLGAFEAEGSFLGAGRLERSPVSRWRRARSSVGEAKSSWVGGKTPSTRPSSCPRSVVSGVRIS